MAETKHSTPASAQQPGLRSYIVFDHIPDGCIAVEVVDRSAAPHLNRGDFVLVDTADREPAHGEHSVIRWSSGEMQVVDLRLKPGRYGACIDGKYEFDALWWAQWQGAMYRLDGRAAEVSTWGDGPYRAEQLAEKLVGKVVGIYQPNFMPVLRPAA